MEGRTFDPKEIKKEIGRKPELVPLSSEQKEGFLYLWRKFPKYESRRVIVSEIPSLFWNRDRYRELLPEADRAVFDQIEQDPLTKF